MRRFDAVVLAGGRARRMAGLDKPGEAVGGLPLVERVAAAAREAERLIVVGPPRSGLPGAIVVREDPPGAGPVPAVAAALPEVRAPWVALLAGDLPFLTPADLHTLDQALNLTHPRPEKADTRSEGADAHPGGSDAHPGGVDAHPGGSDAHPGGADARPERIGGEPGVLSGTPHGAVLVDAAGREQWLIGMWRTERLRAALGSYEGSSLRGLLAPLEPRRVPPPKSLDRPAPWLDCDTTDDLAAARAAAQTATRDAVRDAAWGAARKDAP